MSSGRGRYSVSIVKPATWKGIAAAVGVLAASGLGAATASAQPIAATSPAITGTAAYGQTLTCRNGTWSAGAGSFTYQWQLADGNVVIGSAPTLKVRAIWVGLGIDCVVTATDSTGATATATSAPVSPVAATTTVKITKTSVSSTRKLRISGTISPTASLNGGAGSLILYRQSIYGLVQLSFNGAQTRPGHSGAFTLTASGEPAGTHTYVIQYIPSSIGYGGQALATRKIRIP